jgi:hypothetical protein
MKTNGPVTIADLSRKGELLEVGCMRCGRHGYFEIERLRRSKSNRSPDWLPVPKVRDQLRCSNCGARNRGTINHPIWTRGDCRPPPMGASADERIRVREPMLAFAGRPRNSFATPVC